MHRFAEECGYSACFLAKGRTEYQVGLLAKRGAEAELVGSYVGKDSPFLHGLLLVRVRFPAGAGSKPWIYVVVAHFTPRSSVAREAECQAVVDQVLPMAQGHPFLLAGDLNALSPQDSEVHTSQGLLASLLAADQAHKRNKLRKKFLVQLQPAASEPKQGSQASPPNYAINYSPMRALLHAGLRDLWHYPRLRRPEHTVPTNMCRDSGHAAPMRIDYMLANGSFCRAFPPPCPSRWEPPPPPLLEVCVSSVTHAISDHFPLLGCFPTDRLAPAPASGSLVAVRGPLAASHIADLQALYDAEPETWKPKPERAEYMARKAAKLQLGLVQKGSERGDPPGEPGSRLVGYVVVTGNLEGGDPLLEDLVVAKEHRKRGVGIRLVQMLLEHPAIKASQRLDLYCYPSLMPFYGKFGFRKVRGGEDPTSKAFMRLQISSR